MMASITYRWSRHILFIAAASLVLFAFPGEALAQFPVANPDSYGIDEDVVLNVPAPGVLGNDTGTGLETYFISGTSHGSLTLNADGSFTYTPYANYFGGDQFRYKARVGDFLSIYDTTVTITVNSVNDKPTITDIADQGIDEDTATGAIDFTVGDVETAAGSLTVLRSSSNETLVPVGNIVFGGSDANRTVTVTPAADQFGNATITITVSDGEAGADESFVLTVNPVNDAPTIGGSPETSVDEDAPYSFTPTAFDVDVGDTLTFSIENRPLWAGFDPETGTLSGTPGNGDVGTTAGVVIRVSDGEESAALGSFDLRVVNVNDAPEAGDDAAAVDEDSTDNEIDVLANDIDIDVGDSVTLDAITSEPSHGTASIFAGKILYSPAENYFGQDALTYQVHDGSGATDTATVNITVNPVNDVPTITAVEDQTIDEDTATGAIAFTVGDVETEAGSLTLSGSSSNEALVPVSNIVFGGTGADRTVTVTPALDQFGNATITITVSDGEAGVDESFLVVVNPVNDAPVIEGSVPDQTKDEDAPSWTLDLTPFESDVEDSGAGLNWSVGGVDTALFSAAITDPENDILTFTPVADAFGSDAITLTLTDSGGLSVSQDVIVTINAMNDTPTDVVLSEIRVDENQPAGTIVGNFTTEDVDASDIHVYRLVDGVTYPDNGFFTVEGNVLKTAAVFDFEAKSSYSIKVETDDQNGGAYEEVFVIAVGDVNDAPVLEDQSFVVDENTAGGFSVGIVAASDEDAGDSLSYSITAGNETGVFAINSSTGEITVEGALDYETTSQYSLVLRVEDSGTLTDTATVTVAVRDVNEAPVAFADSAGVAEGGTVGVLGSGQGSLLANDTDPEGNELTAVLVGGPNYASSFSLNPNGTFSYTHDGGENFEDSFTYKANDGEFDSNTVAVSIAITAVNDVPVITGQSALSTAEDTALTISLDDLTVTDPDSVYPGAFTLIVLDGINYTHTGGSIMPAPEFNGTLSVRVRVNDGEAESDLFNLDVGVTPVNDRPTATSAVITTDEDTVSAGVTPSVTDVDSGDTHTFSIVSQPANGTASVVSNQLVYTPNANYNGADSFTFRAVDSGELSVEGTADVTVLAVNDAPVVNDQGFGVDENAPNGTAVGTVAASDEEIPAQSLTYAITGGSGQGAFTINASSGEISVADASRLDYEASSSLTLEVEVTDDGTPSLSDAGTITISVNNVNETPSVQDSVFSVAEDAATGSPVGSVTASDADAGDSLAYAITGGNTDDVFAITGDTGVITVAGVLDYETTSSYSLAVQVEDSGGLSATAAVTINVTDVNEAPVVSEIPDQTVNEGDGFVTISLDGYVSDEDNTDGEITWTYRGNAELMVSIDPSRVVTIGIPDENWNGSETITFRAADPDGLFGEDSAVFTVTAVNDVPRITGPTSASIAENTELTISLSDLTVEDPDNDYPSDFSLTVFDGANYTRVNNTIAPVLDFVGMLTVSVSVNDGAAESPVFDLSVEVLKDNDGDRIPDVDDPDDDNDGMPDTWEIENGLDPEVDDGANDPDHDGLTNLQEYNGGMNSTDPWMTDTDGDGVGDSTDTDPLNDEETPQIGLSTSFWGVTDVTPKAFSVVWVADQEASCYVNVYADPDGNNLIKGLTITDESADHPPAGENGVMKVTISGLDLGTTYYFQRVTTSDEGVLVEPALKLLTGELPSVRTELSSGVAVNDTIRHRILRSDGSNAWGALLVAEVEGGRYPVTGWVGNDIDPPWALVNLRNIYDAAGEGNLELFGGEAITLDSIGGLVGFRVLRVDQYGNPLTVPEEVGGMQTLQIFDPENPEEDPVPPNDDQCTLDTVGPVIDAEQLVPDPDVPTNDVAPFISAKYSDAYSEVDPASVVLKVDGQEVPGQDVVADSEGLEYTLPDTAQLSEGIHEVTISVSDEWGNESEPFTWLFEVDLTPPVVTITEPTENDYLYPALQVVRWSVDEAEAGLSSVSVWSNGIPADPAPSAGDTAAQVTLDSGVNIVEVWVVDLAGNTGTDSVQVNLDVDTDGDGTGDYYDEDDDNDGMPDDYEMAYNLNSLDPFDAGHDEDGDGHANLTEYVAGTNPQNAADVPGIPFEVKYITVTDVTQEGFSVIWQSSEQSTCGLVVYDETNRALSSVDRISESALHNPAEFLGVMKVRVSGLQPATTYRFQTLTVFNDLPVFTPAYSELLEVTTEAGAAPVGNDLIKQMIYDENGNAADGALLVASVEGAHYPVTAWVGEGLASPWARVDLNGVYSQLLGGEELTLWAFGGRLGHYVNVQETPAPLGIEDTALPDTCYLSPETAFSLDLRTDLNIVGISSVPIKGLTAHDLLRYMRDQAAGDTGVVESIRRYNTETGEWEMVSWLDGEPGNGDFPIKVGEAYLVYMGWDVDNLRLEGIAHGASVHLSAGLNLVSLPATQEPIDFTGYEMLGSLGGETEVSSVSRYDDVWGWETAAWFDLLPAGRDFDTRQGEGYLIYMNEDMVNWRPF
jgi:VCBS repeat-containing protein